MKRCIAWVTLAGLLLFTGVACGPKAVTIKMKTSGKGDVTAITKEEKTTITMKLVDAKGELKKDKEGKAMMDDKKVMTDIVEFEETILEREGTKTPEKFEREYTKWEKKQGDKSTDIPIKGKKIVIEKNKDGKYDVTYKDDGKKVEGMAAMALMMDLAKMGEKNEEELLRIMLPKTPVKPGETWKVDTEALLKEMTKSEKKPPKFDTAKATGTGKLLKTYPKDGKQFGEMTIEMKIPITEMEGKNQPEDTALVWDMKLDCCIDGTLDAGTITHKVSMTNTMPNEDGSKAIMTINLEGTETHKEVAKKK